MNNLYTSSLYTLVQLYQQTISKRIAFLEKRREAIPQGKNIKYYTKKGAIYYSYRSERTKQNHYLNRKDFKTITTLVNAKYIDQTIAVLKRNLSAANKFLKNHSQTEEAFIAENFPEEIQTLNEKLYPRKQTIIENWLKQPYIRNPYKPENIIFDSERGEKMRSKSEVQIANSLLKHLIAYKPECPITIEGRKLYPDFTILRADTLEEIIWEHFGLMDVPEYATDAIKKIQLYMQNGYIYGKNLILTFETSQNPLTAKMIENYIQTFLLNPINLHDELEKLIKCK